MILDNLICNVILIIFGLSAAIQIFYYAYFYIAPGLQRRFYSFSVNSPVSVIICARNEEKNLSSFLPEVLEQDYPDFEVIVVNDCSEDNSFKVLGDFLVKYPHLRVSEISKDPKFTHNKKFAQFIGIKAAKNELLLFTDADCRPESDKWLAYMVSNFNEKIDFVIGYGGYKAEKGLLNKYIRYDSLFIAVQYMGMAIRGIPYMGVGRNLAYRKTLFFKSKGFGSHTHLVSGDDDLFVNRHARKENTAVEFRKEAHTRSIPPKTFIELFRQKKRHLTTAHHYKLRDKIILITEPLARTLFYFSLVFLIAKSCFLPVVISVAAARLLLQVIVLILAQKRFNEPALFIYSLFFDIFSPFINLIFYSGIFRKTRGRNIWS